MPRDGSINQKLAYLKPDTAWAGLGINYVIPVNHWNMLEDPELRIITSLEDFVRDPRLLGMFFAWAEVYDELINVERLMGFLRELKPYQLAVLGAASGKLRRIERWQKLNQKISGMLGKHVPQFDLPDIYRRLADLSGADPDFKAFGIVIPTVKISDHKKLKNKNEIAKHNIWFRLRCLFGNHMRADVIIAMKVLKKTNAYQVEKYLRCSRETAYRHFKDLNSDLISELVDVMLAATTV